MTIPADTTPPPMTEAELDAIERFQSAYRPPVMDDAPTRYFMEKRLPQLIALARQALRDRTPAPPPDADDATRLARRLVQAKRSASHYAIALVNVADAERAAALIEQLAATRAVLAEVSDLLKDHEGETVADKVRSCIEISNDVVGDARLLYDMEEYPGKVQMVQELRDATTRCAELNTVLARCVAVMKLWVELHDEPCRVDHHGVCQSHYMQPLENCIVPVTRAALADAARAGGKAEGR